MSQRLATSVREPGQHDPRVAFEAIPPDEALVDQTIHHSGEAARREHHALGQLAHPQTAVGSARQTEKHVVITQREPVLLAKLGVELSDDLVMCVQERLPGAKLRVAEVRRHFVTLYQGNTFTYKYPSAIFFAVQILW
jgi:hypothetical protein